MTEELTLEKLESMAHRRGLTLAQEELQKLLPGVIRAREQAVGLRNLLAHTDEPASIFKAARNDGK